MTENFQPPVVRALARRGLKTYVETPAAYVALFVFYLYSSYLFAMPFFFNGQASLAPLVDIETLLLTLLVPALTMGLLAEEFAAGTFETLATMPVLAWDVVLGKFLAFAAVSAAAVAGFAVFAFAAAGLAQPHAGFDWGQAFCALAALVLLSWLLGAAGLFASSWGKRQITAYIGAFLIGFALFLLGKITPFLPAAAAPPCDFLGFDSHVRELDKGVLDLRDLLYFATMIFGFLFLTAEGLKRGRR
jgi:ABC-2 type transport system permease protein